MLEILNALRAKAVEIRRTEGGDTPDLRRIYQCMAILSEGLDEHPEGWDEACCCADCRSYGG